jgi:hypothetical protein
VAVFDVDDIVQSLQAVRQESGNFYVAHALDSAVREFAARLPETRRLLDDDVLAACYGDPAAGSVGEVLLCYPGILAMIHHRLAHELYRRRVLYRSRHRCGDRRNRRDRAARACLGHPGCCAG